LILAEARRPVGDALDSEPRALDPAEFGMDLSGEAIRFDTSPALRASQPSRAVGKGQRKKLKGKVKGKRKIIPFYFCLLPFSF